MIDDIFLIFAPNIDCRCSIETLWWGGTSTYNLFFKPKEGK